MEASERSGEPGFQPYEVYLFHEMARDRLEEDAPVQHRAFGACGFRWGDRGEGKAGWELQWAWLHPYWRREGHLSDLWPCLRAEYGDFEIDGPLSLAMRAFLAKRDSRFGGTEC